MNVACSTSGCTNPVVGQCSGYKGNCGRFYCAKHSSDGLCPACAARKARDIEVQRMLAEYTQKAESLGLGVEVDLWDWVIAIFAGIFVGIFAVNIIGGVVAIILILAAHILGIDYDNYVAAGIFASVTLLSSIATFIVTAVRIIKNAEERQAALDEYAETHPGFREFYDVWSEAKKAQQEVENAIYMRALLDGIDAYNHERTRQEVEKAARKINRR